MIECWRLGVPVWVGRVAVSPRLLEPAPPVTCMVVIDVRLCGAGAVSSQGCVAWRAITTGLA